MKLKKYEQFFRAVFSCFQGKKDFFFKYCSDRTKKFHNMYRFYEKNSIFFVKKKNNISENISTNFFFIFHADHSNADWMFLITIKVFLITLKIKENHLFPLYVHGLNEMLNEREYYMRKKHKIVFVVFDSLITLYILCFTAFVFIQKIAMRKCVKNIP